MRATVHFIQRQPLGPWDWRLAAVRNTKGVWNEAHPPKQKRERTEQHRNPKRPPHPPIGVTKFIPTTRPLRDDIGIKNSARYQGCLTMRLSDARVRRSQTKRLYRNHRSAPWLAEAATPRDRSNRLLEDARRSTQAINGTATTSLIWSVTKNTGWPLQTIGQMLGANEGATAATVASEAAMNPNRTASFRAIITAAMPIGRAAKRTAAVCNVTSHVTAPTCLLENTSNHQLGQ
jgi:hypothetical protein